MRAKSWNGNRCEILHEIVLGWQFKDARVAWASKIHIVVDGVVSRFSVPRLVFRREQYRRVEGVTIHYGRRPVV